MTKSFLHRGLSLIELMVVIGLCAILLPAILTGTVSSRGGKAQLKERTSALAYLKETVEQLKIINENNWADLAPLDTDLHVVPSDAGWNMDTGIEPIDGFTRKVVLSRVYRDAENALLETGGTESQIDPSTLKAIVTVAWTEPNAASVQSSLFLSRHVTTHHDDIAQTDFSEGITTNTQVSDTTGGEVILGPGTATTNTKWCEPSFSTQSVNLPEVPTSVSATPGNVYVGMGNSSSVIASFAHIKVATNPLTFTISGTLAGGYRATSVFGEPDWGYITTNRTDGERLIIIDLNRTDNTPNKILHKEGSFSLTHTENGDPATSIFVLDNRGYLTVGNYLYVLDLSNHANPTKIGERIQFSNNNLGFSPAKQTMVRKVGTNTYAFIAINGAFENEMQIVDVTNHINSNQWKVIGGVDIDPAVNGEYCTTLTTTMGVYVKPDGNTAYISTANTGSSKNFIVINTSNKSNPTIYGGPTVKPACVPGGGWESGSMTVNQSVVTLPLENKAIVVGTGGTEQYVVLDLGNEASPTRCGGLSYTGGLSGVASTQEANGEVFAFVITTTKTNALKVIQGGPDVASGTYAASGTYESGTFDALSSVVFNRFLASVSIPSGTNIKFQVAATDAVAGSCSGVPFNFVGPDNSSATYFTPSGNLVSGAIPLSSSGTFKNPSRCFRYRGYFTTTNTNLTPTINSVTLNYSL